MKKLWDIIFTVQEQFVGYKTIPLGNLQSLQIKRGPNSNTDRRWDLVGKVYLCGKFN